MKAMDTTSDQVNLDQIHRQFIATRSDATETDNWKLLITHDEIQGMIQWLANRINQTFRGEKIVVTCILKGCAYFLVDLTKRLTIPHSLYFIEASSYHDQQLQSEAIEILSRLVPSKFQGRKVILLDELYDNGFTLHAVKHKLIDETKIQASDIFTCTLFHKFKSHHNYGLPDLVGFRDLPDLWYVGYGLDDKQEKRNWPHLYAIPKLPGIPTGPDDSIFETTEEGRQHYHTIRNTIVSMIRH
jgi:hypoxanthine phosphoribosyltransferase